MTTSPRHKGFTLIELLVVISIIGVLSSVVLASLNTARAKAFDAKRLSNLTTIRTALEMYYIDHNAYPIVGNWSSRCAEWPDNWAGGNVIPGLVPTYLPRMPDDPQMNTTANTCCYLYYSDGTDYKFLAYNCSTSYACYGSGEATGGFPDPVRPVNACAIYTPGMANQ